jgi:diguanylate cyclase (GGDEF)-like protein
MKTKPIKYQGKAAKALNPSPKRTDYTPFFIAYILFCMLTIIIVSVILSGPIKQNTVNNINNTLSLMSEKVNTSFDMMTDYLIEAADIVSLKNDSDFNKTYDMLQNTLSDMPYYSIGLLSHTGKVYGTAGEKADMEKHGYSTSMYSGNGIYITEPYRSSVTGSNMLTMFKPVYNQRDYAGSVFVTYSLETVQKLAYTSILSDKTSVFLMNPHSGNFVSCSADANAPAGTWNNIRLVKNRIVSNKDYTFDEWVENMAQNGENNIVNCTIDGVGYAIAYTNIEGMDNWSLIIRVPVGELSTTMQQFTVGVVICASIIMLATLLLAIKIYLSESNRNKALQTLSYIDPLTKVINRRAFENKLDAMFAAKRKPDAATFIFFDIDYFKAVNDTHGHDAGDQVLCIVASALTDIFADTAIVARVGGDEFNILVYEPLTVAEIDSLMAALRVRLKETVLDTGTALPVSYSAGLAVYPQDSTDVKQLVECADKALYHVKEMGRNNHFWYHDLTNK